MGDFQLDLFIGGGPSARSFRIDLPPFTLVAATTRSGLITTPLRERFGIPLRLEFYDTEELTGIVRRGARCRRSEEHTSELQSLMRISYAVFRLKKKTRRDNTQRTNTPTPSPHRNTIT